MGKIVDADGMIEHLKGMIEYLEENKEEEYVFMVGDMMDYNMSVKMDGQVKTVGPVAYVNEAFEGDGVRDLYEGNLALYGTLAVPKSVLSEKGKEIIDGERDGIEVEVEK